MSATNDSLEGGSCTCRICALYKVVLDQEIEDANTSTTVMS
jgi:hypothetical protein